MQNYVFWEKNSSKTVYTLKNFETSTRSIIMETDNERDLGVQLSKNFKWNIQVKNAANRANSVLGMLKRTFIYWNCDTLKNLYVTFVRPHLEYSSSVGSPYLKKDIKILELVQRRATKLAPHLKNLKYEERLKILGLTTLEERRIRGDMIQYYKCLNGYNKIDWFNPNTIVSSVSLNGPASSIRGNKHRLNRQFIRNFPQRENFFTNRIVPYWNDLPSVVIDSKSINSFKANYDKFKAGKLD